ncbi:hypothetical protein TNCV_4464561 [Trichonephila clavipes]|nr:hypothetical protein TNCV_4464561 [Trichonephila clavipes]
MTPSEPNSSIPRDANNSVLSASAKVFHPVVFDATNTDTGPNPPNVNNPSITSCSGFDSNSQVLLCTALVNVCDSFGGTRLCRVLLDPGSQPCLITSSLERLGLPRKRTNVRISCLGHQILELMVVTDELVSNFWKLDSVPEANLLTSEERACEDDFIDTHNISNSCACRLGKDVPSNKDLIGRYKLKQILWRDNPKETVKEYRLTTVTYGTSCAPYLSTRTLTQLAFDERERYPLASFATLHHFLRR